MSTSPVFDRFKGSGDIPGYTPSSDLRRDPMRDPRGYLAGPDLARAVNVALALKAPLLVTGDPGTGKTDLAYRLAAELFGDRLHRFDTKSSSVATDLFYGFDSVRQFARSQSSALQGKEPPPAREFVRWQALGRAILESLDPADVKERLGAPAGHSGPQSSVVLIDEVDKAPRDFPNDLLNQIERMEFAVPELGIEFRARTDHTPAVVITSNSEKQLPEAFLRRCVYHHIDFPDDKDQLTRILGGRLGRIHIGGPALGILLDGFLALRRDLEMTRRPSTSELLDWLRALHLAGFQGQDSVDSQREILVGCLGALAKTREDLERATRWVRDPKNLAGS